MDPLTRPHSGREEAEPDRLSDLPDDILLRIVGDLGLRALVRASGLSRRWRNVPGLLPDLTIDVADFYKDDGDITNQVSPLMQAYAGAARRLLLLATADGAPTLRSVRLRFLLSEPCILHAIGCAVEDILAAVAAMERLELDLLTPAELAAAGGASVQQKAMFRRQFMSFFDAYPVPFGCLTSLALHNLCFGSSDVPRLLESCARMQLLSLSHCDFGMMPAAGSVVVEIDAPHSQLAALEIRFCCFRRVELTQAPELRRFHCDTWYGDNPPVHFGHLPRLRNVTLASNVHRSRTPFALSDCMSAAAAGNLSTLDLDFRDGKIWIRPEDLVKKLSFGNLRDVYLQNIYGLCDLNWTLFVLEAAPSLKNFYIMISRHVCDRSKFPAEVLLDNVRWRTSDFEHHSLQLLEIVGYAQGYLLHEYIRLVMEYAVCLKRIRLLEQDMCSRCGYRPSERSWYTRSQHTDLWHYPSTEGEKDRTRSRLMKGCSSPVKIVIG
ncbi:unnamed protein product [Urochloa humidicola]